MRLPLGPVLSLALALTVACADQRAQPDSGEVREAELRFEQYFGLPGGESEELLLFGAEEEQQFQSAIADCMRQAGFDYRIPPRTASEPAQLPGRRPAREWVEENGFFVVLGEPSEPRTDDTVPSGADLGPEEHQAFGDALFGDGGCYDAASSRRRSAEAVLNAYDDQLSEVFASYINDPSVVRADVLWRSCMRAAGYEFLNLDQLISDLVQRVETAAGDEVELRGLKGYERKAALAAFDCDDEPSRLREAVIERLASQFRDKYADEIVERLASR